MNAPRHVLSIMVVTLNEAEHLPLLKQALDRLHRPEGWTLETILVDGGSRDGTVEAAAELGFDQFLMYPGASIPVCRNHALHAAHGDALAFLDGDCLPAPNWLQEAAPYLVRVEPTLLGYPVQPPPEGNWIQRSWHAHWAHKNAHARSTRQEPVSKDAFRLITTRNMLFNRLLLEVAPAFDESLSTGEDTDFAFRATQAGACVLAVPALNVIHLGEPATLSQYFRQQLWHANRKAYATILKSGGGKNGANAVFFSFAFLAGLIFAIVGLLLALLRWNAGFLLLLLPLAIVTLLPAAWISRRARSFRLFCRLCILYFLYGLARAIDLVGLSPRKASWKFPARI
ncbi:MAG: glycosyltransferase [Verrucomicrobiota bacterium]|jgi:glycosyltransferase involved in cell wall biosynthesis|nr:glycosyltransferase [Verrucomicrobiota bacterium]